MANKSLIQKGTNVIASLNGTEILAEEAKKFIRDMIEPSPLLSKIRVKAVGINGQKIPAMAFTGRFLHRDNEATALPESQRFVPTVSNVNLVPHKFTGVVSLSYDYVEENIEEAGIFQTIMTMAQQAIASDLEDLIVNGNTATGSDDFLKTFDGMLALATSNVFAAGGSAYDKTILRQIELSLPKRYRTSKPKMLHICSDFSYADYNDSIIQRATPWGDSAQQRAIMLDYIGTPIMSTPKMPDTGTAQALYLNPVNAILGIAKQIKIRTVDDPLTGQWHIIYRMKAGFNYEIEAGVVKTTGLLA